MDMDDPHMLHTVATPGTATAVKKQTKTIAAVDDMWTKSDGARFSFSRPIRGRSSSKSTPLMIKCFPFPPLSSPTLDMDKYRKDGLSAG
eukprot:15330049-Ditylum_brightwellii.AAC.1